METALIRNLRQIVGPKNVLTSPGDLHVYSFDSALDRSQPTAVVLPASPGELSQVIKLLSKHKHPFVARGAATSLCGGPVPLNKAIVVGLTRLKKIGKLDAHRGQIKVEPGVVNLKLQEMVGAEGFFYAPDPGSQKACTIGGNVATNAGGPHCLKYGVTSHSVLGVEVIMADGQLMNFNVSDPGYDLVGFFVGSEGTLGVATRILLQLKKKPKFIQTMVVSFGSIEAAIQSVTDITAAGILPATLEAMDKTVVEAVEAFMHAGYPLDAEAVLLIEVDGASKETLDKQVQVIKEVCQRNQSTDFQFAESEEERRRLWEGRRGSYAAMARLAPNVLVEDGAVPRTKLPEATRRIKEIAQNNSLRVALLFHAGDGNLHPQIIFDERDREQTQIVKKAGYEMLKACVDLGGTISGEHGIGIDKREAMKWLFSRETLSLFRRLKNTFDPLNLCNPDKLIPLVSKSKKSIKQQEKKDGETENKNISPLGFAQPQSVDELVGMVEGWAKGKNIFGVCGLGTKFRHDESVMVSTVNLNKVLDFDKGNLSICVQAGASLKDVRAMVEAEKQYLWVAGDGTVGGTIATKASQLPPLRDQILAMRVLLPTGEVVTFGAKTMKNVAGYDVPKLLIGSWGTLGIILDVTFRLFPYPPPKMQAQQVQPFIMKDIHKKIKKAFDPYGIMSPRTVSLKPDDIRILQRQLKPVPKQQQPKPQEQKVETKKETSNPKPPEVDRYGDGFWSQ